MITTRAIPMIAVLVLTTNRGKRTKDYRQPESLG